jgi:hypothetical protein
MAMGRTISQGNRTDAEIDGSVYRPASPKTSNRPDASNLRRTEQKIAAELGLSWFRATGTTGMHPSPGPVKNA